MKLTLSWLKKFLETNLDVDVIIDGFNKIGLEVENVEKQNETYKPFIVAEIIHATPHPEADKLKICQVNTGTETLQIVCDASNARGGIKVVLAPIGTIIPANGLKIKQSKIRGIDSCGMLCSEAELLLAEESDGILELSENFIVGASFAEQYGKNECIIELSMTPNRGDCLGVYGIARDLAAAGYGNLKALEAKNYTSSFSSPIKVDVQTENCPKYVGRYFKNIKNSPSPTWLCDLLSNIGVKPISALVDITNYFTFAFGRPMHVFDADKISDINVRYAKNGEEFLALNDKNYKLNEKDIVIASGENIVGLAGIIGEKDSGVSLDTKNIFLEIGLFDQDHIIKSSRHHQIESDAKYRFERKVDPEFLEKALDLATQMIIEICKGEASEAIIINKSIYQPRFLDFPLNSLKKRLGITFETKSVIEILKSLGFEVKHNGETLNLTIPSWRHDISIKEDIVEEVARIHGYDKISAIELENKDLGQLDGKQKLIYKIARFPASLGLDELVTYSFMNSKKAALFKSLNEELYIKNPISSELDYLRNSIIPNLLEAAQRNQNRGIDSVSFYELASCFEGINPHEQFLCLSGLRTNNFREKNIYNDQRKVDLFDAKADCFAIINEFGMDANKLQYSTVELPSYYHPGRASSLKLGKLVVAHFGELHPRIIKEYDLKSNAVAFEIFIDNLPLPKSKFGRKTNITISDFQEVERDFAFILDKDVQVDNIIKNVSSIDKKLITQVDLFDIYMGSNIEAGKKSIAFKVTMQAQDRTLTEPEIEEISNKVIASLESNYHAVLRSC